ncbi:MAG: DUF1415 domain-containing protein [Dokdonella sp.]
MNDCISSAVDDPVDDAVVMAATRRWIERAVIGLNLCPFARVPVASGRVHVRVSHARDVETLAADLHDEAQRLIDTDATAIETTLLIHPYVLGDFLDYNDFLDIADAVLDELDLDGELQIASFHPRYQFADAQIDAIENCTNRSPYPILQLLREASIEQGVAAIGDADAIYRRNIETLRRLGSAGWHALWSGNDSAPVSAAQ